MGYTTFQSCPNVGKGEQIVCVLCGYEKTNDYPLEKKCTVRKNHKWKAKSEVQANKESKLTELEFLEKYTKGFHKSNFYPSSIDMTCECSDCKAMIKRIQRLRQDALHLTNENHSQELKNVHVVKDANTGHQKDANVSGAENPTPDTSSKGCGKVVHHSGYMGSQHQTPCGSIGYGELQLCSECQERHVNEQGEKNDIN